MKSIKLYLVVLVSFVFVFPLFSQQQGDAEYTKVLTDRADKIVRTLGIQDQGVQQRAIAIMVKQYKGLGLIHDTLEADIKKAKESNGNSKEATGKAIAGLKTAADVKLYNLHCEYIGALSSELTPAQVDQVKDGMTYGVVKVTYDSYCDMIPSLKEDEKRQLMAWMIEAREHAMDASSSKAKHEWFGKYKGRFNNYLSARGYDIQQERKGWQERLKAEKR